MPDSLLLATSIELLGGGVASAIPACAGAVFRLAPGWDFSGPDPTASVVASLVLDGERPVGRRSSNRTPSLPVVIIAPTRQILAAAREVLLRAIDQDYFTLQWSRGDGTGLPVVFDCFRASTTVINWSLKNDNALVCQLTLSFSALPYGRNDTPVIVDFPSPLVGKSAPPAAVVIDNYSTVTGTHWSQSASGPGPQSAYWTTGTDGTGQVATYARSGIGPFNLTGLNALTVWAGFGSTGYFPWWGLRKAGPVQFAVTLTDGAHSRTVHVTRRVQLSNNSFAPVWQKIRVPMPSGGSLNLAAVTGYTITVSSRAAGDLPYTDLYLDSFTAVPFASAVPVAPVAGTVYDLAGIAGSARSAVSLQLSQPAGVTQQYTKKFTTPGAFSWVAPAACTAVQRAEAYAAGGRGGAGPGSGGGGGAEYAAEPGVPVTAGTAYPVTVPAGGSTGAGSAGNASFAGDGGITVTAHGGANVAGSSGGAGGSGYAPREQLSTANQGFEGSTGTWAAATNGAAPSDTAAQHHSGSNAMQMSSSAAGDMIYGSATPASFATQCEPCDPLYSVLVNGWCRSAVSARSVFAGAEFYDVNGVSLGQLFGASVTSSTSAWTALTQATLTPPAGSVWCRALVKVAATGAGAEVHYADDMSLKSGMSHAGGTGGAGSGSGEGGGGGAGGPASAGGTGGASSGGGTAGTSGGGDAGTGGTGAAAGQSGHTGNPAGGGGAGNSSGANGEVALSYTATKAFKTLIVHRPGMDAPDTLSPFVPLGITDTPDGTIAYPVPTLVAGQPARFGSTYTVILVNNSWNNPSASRTLTVSVNHYEQTGGNVYTQSIARTLTPNALASPFCVLGELTLPDHVLPDDNTNAYFTVNVQSGNTADRFQDVLFLDTLGSTVMIESPAAYVSYWIDEPPTTADIGNIMGSMFDRPDAVSVLAYATVSGPPIHVDPLGNQSLLVYSGDAGAPACELTMFARWLQERLS